MVRAKTRRTANTTDTTVVYPVVGTPVELRVRKGRKKGSSRTARRLEDIERDVSRALRRVSRAVKHGMDTYVEERDESARRRRDGALVDFYNNVAEGVSRAVAEAAPAIPDVSYAFNTGRLRKQIRRTLRSIPMIF
ncbi:MAG TPA: hypothetical protein VF544_03815 [Pyrinomonadaceae bacterium]|jgi:hypothetical protein